MPAPTVFISYSHDSPEHENHVLDFANQLRRDGIDCSLDQYEVSPPEGWPKWMDRQIARSDFILLICTETFFRRVMDDEKPGTGRGVKWESTLTYQHLYNDDTLNTRFIPILFDSGIEKYIPTPLQGATYYRVPQQYDDLYRRLTNQPRTIKPEIGKLKALPSRERKADYLGVKIFLAKLPSTSPDLFGRERELALLDAAWESPPPSNSPRFAGGELTKANVLTLVAWGVWARARSSTNG